MDLPKSESGEGRDDVISFKPYIDAVWRYRQAIAAAVVLALALFAVVALFLLFYYPSERVGSVQFRFMFSGAAQGKYPNDTLFSPIEIVAAPVITEVFRKNDLQRFGSYDAFKDGLFLQQSNPELDLMAYSYQARLADLKLTAVERANLESEYRSRRESLSDPVFLLSFRRSERFNRIPRDVLEKTLSDTLVEWAQQADVRKGVLKYDVPILSSKLLSRDSVLALDYLIAADRLRAQAGRIIRTLDQLMQVPGAMTVRSTTEDISLPEIKAKLEDVVRFDLEPLMGTIRSEGVTKNARVLSIYASNMVFQLTLDKQETEARARALQRALSDYLSQNSSRSEVVNSQGGGGPTRGDAAVMPQLSESFLDRLEKMSVQAQKGEMEYRRKLTDQALMETKLAATYDKELAYYKDLESSLAHMGNRGGGGDLVPALAERSGQAFDAIEKATNQAVAIYQELSAHNLNPAARLYAITSPYSEHVQRSMSLNRLAVPFLLVMLVTIMLGVAGALAHSAAHDRRLEVKTASSSTPV